MAQTIAPPQLLQTLISHCDVTNNNVIFDNTCIYVVDPYKVIGREQSWLSIPNGILHSGGSMGGAWGPGPLLL